MILRNVTARERVCDSCAHGCPSRSDALALFLSLSHTMHAMIRATPSPPIRPSAWLPALLPACAWGHLSRRLDEDEWLLTHSSLTNACTVHVDMNGMEWIDVRMYVM